MFAFLAYVAHAAANLIRDALVKVRQLLHTAAVLEIFAVLDHRVQIGAKKRKWRRKKKKQNRLFNAMRVPPTKAADAPQTPVSFHRTPSSLPQAEPVLLLLQVVAVVLLNHADVPRTICVGVEEDARRRLAIAARTACLLVVALHGLWQAVVDDIAHVGLVNAHAKRNCGADDMDVACGPALLGLLAHVGIKASVVRLCLDPLRLAGRKLRER